LVQAYKMGKTYDRLLQQFTCKNTNKDAGEGFEFLEHPSEKFYKIYVYHFKPKYG